MKSPQSAWVSFTLLFAIFLALVIIATLVTPLATGETPHYAPPPTLDLNLLPPVKRTVVLLDQARRETALAGPTPRPFKTPPEWATPVPTVLSNIPRRKAGAGTIVETGQAPYPAMEFLFENNWYAETGKEVIMVWAGAAGDDPKQGVVVTAYLPIAGTRSPLPGGAYKTPTKSGSLHIVDADGMRLKLVSKSGATFYFDVAAAKFVSP